MGGWPVRPLALGADVVASATKWIGGHGTTIGGLLLMRNTPRPRPRAEPLRGVPAHSRRPACARRGTANAAELAAALLKDPHVAWDSYLDLPAHPSHERALATLRPSVFGGVLNFGVKGAANQANKVVDLLKLASNLANLGVSPPPRSFSACIHGIAPPCLPPPCLVSPSSPLACILLLLYRVIVLDSYPPIDRLPFFTGDVIYHIL
ncbi:Cys/Met metabolism PLP-dependent enzyme-domain-containing protein [Mycena maculata]|uniref:Cys/Met metabolism PLP-dependent enzyme-domain-containing protein n=1 Tax=Mycena maculata TaxID=230809 RepID=A0AAD7IZ79_9AGAR|nr:Cys/Met metabolism PLP-dependent enzyme-domain-containing protein [Mycena maculata]